LENILIRQKEALAISKEDQYPQAIRRKNSDFFLNNDIPNPKLKKMQKKSY